MKQFHKNRSHLLPKLQNIILKNSGGGSKQPRAQIEPGSRLLSSAVAMDIA